MGKRGRRSSQLGSLKDNEQWIYLGCEYERWQMLKIKSGASTDIELLTMLVDSYIKFHIKDCELSQGTIREPWSKHHVETSTGDTEKAQEPNTGQQTEIKMECDSYKESQATITTDESLETRVPVTDTETDTHKNDIGVKINNQIGTNVNHHSSTSVLHTESSNDSNNSNMDIQRGAYGSLLDLYKDTKQDTNSENRDLRTGQNMRTQTVRNSDNGGASSTECGQTTSQQEESPKEGMPTTVMCGDEVITIKVEEHDDTEAQSEPKEKPATSSSQSATGTSRQSVLIMENDGHESHDCQEGSFVATEKVLPCNNSNKDKLDAYLSDLEDMKYKCIECSKLFSTKSNLKRHEKSHSNNGMLKCKECSMTLESNEAMRAHIISAHKQVALCSECGIECGSRTNLNKHRRLKHSDTLAGLRKPMICPVERCNKIFIHKAKYEDHMFTHSNIRPHVCEICAKSFSCRYSRNLHQRKCAGEIVIQCDTCKIILRDHTSLRRHKEAQHEHTKHSCHCGKTFKYESNLSRHKKTVHNA